MVLRRRRERERESNCGEIKTFEEYAKYFEAEKTNNKEQVIRNTYKLNELLHKHGIPEKISRKFSKTASQLICFAMHIINNSVFMPSHTAE